MNPAPEPPPPEPGPPSPALAPVPPDAGLGRKIAWAVFASIATAPLACLVGNLVWFLLVLVLENFASHWSARTTSTLLLLAEVAGIATGIATTAGLVWLGLRRRWHGRLGLGLAAAVAVALVTTLVVMFREANRSSVDKSVLSNVRQISAAADQYFLENGVSTVSRANLVGSSNYVKAVNTVAGETYPQFYTQGVTITAGGVAGARTVTYAP